MNYDASKLTLVSAKKGASAVDFNMVAINKNEPGKVLYGFGVAEEGPGADPVVIPAGSLLDLTFTVNDDVALNEEIALTLQLDDMVAADGSDLLTQLNNGEVVAGDEPAPEPSEEPSVEPSQEPSVEPSEEPSVDPSQDASQDVSVDTSKDDASKGDVSVDASKDASTVTPDASQSTSAPSDNSGSNPNTGSAGVAGAVSVVAIATVSMAGALALKKKRK